MLERRLQRQGTRDLAAFLSVSAAIGFQRQHEWPAWQRRCHQQACQTRARVLAQSGLPLPSPDAAHAQMLIIPVALPAGVGASRLQRQLLDMHRIEVPLTEHAGRAFVRLSVQAYNSAEDLDALVSALTSTTLMSPGQLC